MLSECNFKNELSNIDKSIYKFRERDLEIRRACYRCRTNIDQKDCILFQIYRQTASNIESKLLDEINNKKKELLNLQCEIYEFEIQREIKEKEIRNLNKEIEAYNNKVVKVRSNDFLKATIGEESYIFYKNNGYLDIVGTNNSTYRITNEGNVLKMKKKKNLINRIKDAILMDFRDKSRETWKGKIGFSYYPIEDAIAILYMNIIKNSDRFDKDKGCGSIHIY